MSDAAMELDQASTRIARLEEALREAELLVEELSTGGSGSISISKWQKRVQALLSDPPSSPLTEALSEVEEAANTPS